MQQTFHSINSLTALCGRRVMNCRRTGEPRFISVMDHRNVPFCAQFVEVSDGQWGFRMTTGEYRPVSDFTAWCFMPVVESESLEELAHDDLMDEDGYPTAKAIATIVNWDWNLLPELFAFMKSLWKYPEAFDMETDEKGVTTYAVSTIGWSGNESLIAALEKNTMAWTLSWKSSTRGGHYVFELKP